MKAAVVTLTALFTSACAGVGHEISSGPQIHIHWAGIYTGDRVSTVRNPNGVIEHQVANFQPLKATDVIPLRPGIRFGLAFTVTGVPQSSIITFRRIVRYPSPGATPKPGQQPLAFSEQPLSCARSVECETGYGLDQGWEMLPGKWTFEVWDGPQKLAEHSFTVVSL